MPISFLKLLGFKLGQCALKSGQRPHDGIEWNRKGQGKLDGAFSNSSEFLHD
jgi:hypothetical protein